MLRRWLARAELSWQAESAAGGKKRRLRRWHVGRRCQAEEAEEVSGCKEERLGGDELKGELGERGILRIRNWKQNWPHRDAEGDGKLDIEMKHIPIYRMREMCGGESRSERHLDAY